MLEKIAPYWKAVAGFVAAVGINVATDLSDGGAPWPQDGGEWVRFLLTVTGGTLAVYMSPKNADTAKHAK
jgi:hypothetical protein